MGPCAISLGPTFRSIMSSQEEYYPKPFYLAPARALLWRGCREPTEDFEGIATLGVR